MRLKAIDAATLLYAAVATAALGVAAAKEFARWGWLALAHALLVLLVLSAPRARRAGPVGRFLAEWYPMILVGALYAEIGVLNVDTGFHHDRWAQRLEEWVFGSQVSYRWIRAMPGVAFSWLMHACYLAYYPVLYAAPLGLWLGGRRDAAARTLLAVMVTFYICYAVFLFFPVAGPRYAFDLAHNAATGIPPARFAQWVLDRGDSWGAAFPSSHVAASVVATVMALRAWRRLGIVLAPFTLGLGFAVVYGQFHYAVDALGGVAVAGAVLAAMWWWAPRPAAEERPAAGSVMGVLGTSG